MATIYQMVDDADVCVGYQIIPDSPPDFMGPPAQPRPPDGPYAYHLVDEQLPLVGLTPTERLMWNGGARTFVELAPLSALIDSTIADIDGAADAARMEVLSRQTNTEEYRRAEAQARAFSGAGYPLTAVPTSVASWASAKWRDGWTAQEAADDIIATADLWYGLLDGIRDLRLHAKEDVRHAEGGQEITARVSAFKTDLSNLMKGSA